MQPTFLARRLHGELNALIHDPVSAKSKNSNTPSDIAVAQGIKVYFIQIVVSGYIVLARSSTLRTDAHLCWCHDLPGKEAIPVDPKLHDSPDTDTAQVYPS